MDRKLALWDSREENVFRQIRWKTVLYFIKWLNKIQVAPFCLIFYFFLHAYCVRPPPCKIQYRRINFVIFFHTRIEPIQGTSKPCIIFLWITHLDWNTSGMVQLQRPESFHLASIFFLIVLELFPWTKNIYSNPLLWEEFLPVVILDTIGTT